ncbi:MAG: M48 family metalloprotease [Sedimenticola sp.]|nr:M48 family metalloprotease [Sedimenticola sp.]
MNIFKGGCRAGAALLATTLFLAGCATNPVTGQSELALVSERSELQIGERQYQPNRQMQGGDYRVDPKLVGYVRSVGEKLAAVSDRKLPYEFVVVNDGTPNAWALPGGKIAINRGLLLELDNEAELASVLGHEIVHAAARHGAKGIERGMVLQGVLVAAGAAASETDYAQLAVGAAAVGANLINQRYSRDAELEADHYGMTYMARAGYDPMAAVKLQETFVRLSEGKQENWLAGLFASHPPSAERVERNRQRARELGGGGELGREQYQSAIAGLKASAPAYKAYQEGRVALQKKRYPEALKLADSAIDMEPREALFHSLRGDALQQKGELRPALDAYDRALALDDRFFRHYLQRGALKARLEDQAGARRDLQQSVALLPTADAHYLLGRLALQAGQRKNALEHFRTASDSPADSGLAAKVALVELDLAEHPQRYLNSRLSVDSEGYLTVRLENPSPLPVNSVQLQLGRLTAGGGFQPQAVFRSRAILAAGEWQVLRTDIRLANRAELREWGSRILGAEIAR